MSVSVKRDHRDAFEAMYSLLARRERRPKPNFHRACDTGDYVVEDIRVAWSVYYCGYRDGAES